MTPRQILLTLGGKFNAEGKRLTIERIAEECQQQGEDASKEGLGKIRRGETEKPNYKIVEALKKVGLKYGLRVEG